MTLAICAASSFCNHFAWNKFVWKNVAPTRSVGRHGHENGCDPMRPKNEKPACQRAFVKLLLFERNLERAKGLEPSTPTLARSCSTTELHPHPRWRRSLAGNGRPMPNAARECNSKNEIQTRPVCPIFVTNMRESTQNNTRRADYRLSAASLGNPGGRRRQIRRRFEAFLGQARRPRKLAIGRIASPTQAIEICRQTAI